MGAEPVSLTASAPATPFSPLPSNPFADPDLNYQLRLIDGEPPVVTLPAGTIVESMHPRAAGRKVLTRRQQVRVHHLNPGRIRQIAERTDADFDLPTITWPGTGGYWVTAQVTPELCAANGVAMPELPVVTAVDPLDVYYYGTEQLSWDYSDRWS